MPGWIALPSSLKYCSFLASTFDISVGAPSLIPVSLSLAPTTGSSTESVIFVALRTATVKSSSTAVTVAFSYSVVFEVMT